MIIRETSFANCRPYAKYLVCAIVALMPFISWGGRAVRAETSTCAEQCTGQSSACWELKNGNKAIYQRCVAQCVKECEAQTPPVVLNPKFLVLGLLYAPPGCTSSANFQCVGSSIADYAEGSSLGTKVSVKDSFKEGIKIGGELDLKIVKFGADVGFDATWSGSSSVAVTKSTSLEITISGNGDGIDHGQDMFLLMLNPTVTLTNKNDNLYWYPGVSDQSAKLIEVFASELRMPRTMRPGVAEVLRKLGFTPEDYACILTLSPFGGYSMGGPRGIEPVYCPGHGPVASAGPSSGLSLDPSRFFPTLWNLPYEPPRQPNPCSTTAKSVLKNEFVGERSSTYEQDLTVDYTVGGGGTFGAGQADKWGLNDTSTFTWTDSSTDSSTTDSTQSASVTITCPSTSYNDPRVNVQVYWDSMFATFLFVLVDPSTMSIVQQGRVQNGSGKPLAGQQVDLTYGGKTYHTLTAPNGSYRFLGPARQPPTSGTGLITVRDVKETVQLGSQTPSVIRVR